MQGWLAVLASVLGISGIGGAASAYFLSQRAKSTIEIQNGQIQALQRRDTEREKELEQWKHKVSELEQAKNILETLTTGTEDVRTFYRQMMQHEVDRERKLLELFERFSAEHKAVLEGLREVRDTIKVIKATS